MRPLVLLALATVALPLAAQQKLDRRIPIDADASIRIQNLAGTTRVIGWDRDSIAVFGSVPAGIDFFFGGKGRLAKLGAERRDESATGPGATLEVRVPRGARVWVKTAEGSISVTGMTGEADLSSVGGSIKVDGVLRVVTAESMEGDVEVNGPSALVRVKTGGGKITLSKSAGDLTANTVSGSLTLMAAMPVTARLETVSGSVIYEGGVDRRGTLEVQTHSGDIELRVPPDIAAEFDVQSIEGGVLPGLLGKGAFGKVPKGRPLLFAAGGGGAHVTLRSFKGQIRILKQ